MDRKILYVQYTNPAGYPPLQHSSRILADAGWNVLFLGTGAFGSDELQLPTHSRVRVQKLAFCHQGWRQKLHYASYIWWTVAWTLRWRPSWVYVSDPLGCPAGLLLSKLPGVRIIYHEHDSPQREGGRSRFMQLVRTARRQLARQAVVCVLPNKQRAERFGIEMGNRSQVVCIWNCPAREEVICDRFETTPDDDVWVLYHGSISPILVPETLLSALALLPERVKLQVTGYETIGSRGYGQRLQALAASLGIAHRFNLSGPLSRAKLLERCRRGDLGISLAPRHSSNFNLQALCGASNKAFDYLACGLALLVSDLPDWRTLFVDAGYGLACNPEDPESIAVAIRWFLEHPTEMRRMGVRGRQRVIAEWNYESQFEPVRRLLGQSLPELPRAVATSP